MHTGSISAAKLAHDTGRKSLEAFGPISTFTAAHRKVMLQCRLVASSSAERGHPSKIWCRCYLVFASCIELFFSDFFFKYHKHRAPEMSLWIELVLRSDEQLWPSQCCSSLCCIWCPWMGLGGLPGETHFEMVSRVSVNTCPQPSFLLFSRSILPRTASNHLHLLRTDPSVRNRNLQMP